MMVRRNILLSLGLALAACSTAPTPACRVDADCASGFCREGGVCGEPDGGSSGAPDAGGEAHPDAGSEPDGGGTGSPDAGSSGTCAANHDGRITAAEVPVRAGLYATFRIATDTAVSSAGTGAADAYVWDLSGALANDTDERVTLEPLAGKWFADSFAGATYAAKLAAGSDLLGVFEVTGDALLLRGVVSPTQDGAYTRLTYDPPVKVLQFPITKGATWTTDSTVSGLASGIAAWYTESYSSEVDRQGTLKAPFGTFDVLRVRTDLTRLAGFLSKQSRTFMFVSECFGTVAAITGNDGDTAGEVTRAAEVRRLAP